LETNNFFAVLEYAEHGNLHDYLSENENLDWIQKIIISKDIASSLKYLQDTVKITHRNLHKMILVNDGNVIISNPIFYELNVGTLSSGKELIGFIDLELIRNHNLQFTKSPDINSLGYFMWSISSGKFPFENFTSVTNLVRRIVWENIRENPVDGTPQSYIDLNQKCWRLSSNEQPSAKELCNQLEIMLQGELLNNLQECPPDEKKIL
ncbi:13348_t:CDS:2, partial [Gigaspora margarita]